MKSLLVSLLRLSGMQFVLAISGVVRFKALALYLGAAGFGEFQQVAVAIGAVATVCSFGLSVGLNRNIAATSKPDERQHLLANANGIVWTLSAIGVTALALLLRYSPATVSQIGIESRPALLAASAVLLLWIPLEGLKNNLIAFLLGALDVKGMTKARSVAVFVGTVASIPLVWLFGIVGAAAQLVLITVVLVAVLAWRCHQLGYSPLRVSLNRSAAYMLASFGMAALAVSFAQQFTEVGVRAELIKQFGAAANGYYQAAISLADQTQMIVVGAISSFALARTSQSPDRESIGATTDLLLTAVIPIATLAFAGLGLLCLPMLVVFYSSQFTQAAPYFPFLLAAFLIRAFVWVIAAPLLSMRRIVLWLALDLTLWGLRYVATLLLLPVIGPQALVAGFMLATSVHLALNLFVYARVLRLPLDMSHVGALALGVGLVLTTAWLGSRAEVPIWSRLVFGGTLCLAYMVATLHSRIGVTQAWKLLQQRYRTVTSP